MRDAPRSAARRWVEGWEVVDLIHRRVGNPPHEGGRRQIAAQEDDSVGQRRSDEAAGPGEVPDLADPACGRPGERHDPQGDPAQDNAGA